MKIVRDRRDARWLPSRFHFALFRLYAYIRLRAAKPEPVRGMILSIDRDQSASESFLVTACVVLAASAYFAALFEDSMSAPAAYLVGIVAAIVSIQALIAIAGVVITFVLRRAVQSAGTLISLLIMTLMIAAGIAVALSDSPARYVAVGFLTLVALNALAAIVVFLLRNRIANAEQSVGAGS